MILLQTLQSSANKFKAHLATSIILDEEKQQNTTPLALPFCSNPYPNSEMLSFAIKGLVTSSHDFLRSLLSTSCILLSLESIAYFPSVVFEQ